jgi:hypothetical protein
MCLMADLAMAFPKVSRSVRVSLRIRRLRSRGVGGRPLASGPIAPGHHRFDWLYVTAFASPATEFFWRLAFI